MNLKEIKELIDKIDSSNIAYFEVKLDNSYIKMDKSLTRSISKENKASNLEEIDKIEKIEKFENLDEKTISVSELEEVSSHSNEEIIDEEDLYIVTSPMVGTFYESPGVGEESYVSIGSKVSKGDTLCIIEAMKLMNEIESEEAGEIVDILVRNGNMVEYGQPLFKIRRA